MVNDNLIAQFCDQNKLISEQIEAIKAITQSTDRVLAIQGHPGTGKTTMLATVVDILAARELLAAEGYELLGLASMHVAVKELKNRGIHAQTLDSFIHAFKSSQQYQATPTKRSHLILVIDEASMVSNRKMLDVLQIAHALDCRAIPAGDVRQLSSPEAGKPFHLIQQTDVETKYLTQIRRQQNPILIQAVKESIDFDFNAALATLKASITEVRIAKQQGNGLTREEFVLQSRSKRVGVLVNDYFSYPKSQRDNIQVITPGHKDRVIANTLIREQLKQEGTLASQDRVYSILTAKSMTQVERSHITNLSIGDVLRFGKRESHQIKAGDYLTIVEIHKDHRALKLKREDGRELAWQVPVFDKKRLNCVEVFKQEKRDLQAGDVIRWSRSDSASSLLSSESALVTNVEKNKITVTLTNKKTFTFDANNAKYQHWDHGYAATVYAVQGKTKEIVLAHLESFRENLTSQPAFLVSLTRAVNEFRLYTDSIERLSKRIEENTGVKLSSLEVIGEYPSRQIKLNPLKEKTPTVFDAVCALKSRDKPGSQLFNQETIDAIKDGLNKDAAKLAITILGAPKVKGGHYLKFGSNKGSLKVTIKGENQGCFNDFDTDQGGRDMVKFLQVHAGMNREEALRYGASWLGILSNLTAVSFKARTRVASTANIVGQSGFTAYQLGRIQSAKQLAHESVSIKGTIAEKYLRVHRGIEMENSSSDIRFHPKIYTAQNRKALPALLGIARDRYGKVQSVEAIYLDPKTADIADVPLQKQTIGPKKGAAVMIKQTQDPSAPTLVAEGIVTGLSVASISNVNVAISLGKQMFASLDPKILSKKVIFCLDNDGKKLTSDATILAASTRLKEHKKDVSFMVPSGLQMLKYDYNDVLKQKGSEVIRRDFLHTIPYEAFYSNAEKMTTSPVKMPSEKVIMGVAKRENSIDSRVEKVVNVASPQAISDDFIVAFAKEMGTKKWVSDHQKVRIDEAISSDFHPKEPTKIIQKLKENDREI